MIMSEKDSHTSGAFGSLAALQLQTPRPRRAMQQLSFLCGVQVQQEEQQRTSGLSRSHRSYSVGSDSVLKPQSRGLQGQQQLARVSGLSYDVFCRPGNPAPLTSHDHSAVEDSDIDLSGDAHILFQ
jgi:hypothetical protein